MSGTAEEIKRLYKMITTSGKLPQPKRFLLGWKCPTCDSKLRKQSLKEVIVVGEGANDLVKDVAKWAGLSPGAYTLTVDHLKCQCGYEFVKINTDALKDMG